MNTCTENYDILDLFVIPKITSIVNGDADRVDSTNMPHHSNIICKFLGVDDDIGPAPLQNTTKLTDTLEIIGVVLNASTNGMMQILQSMNCKKIFHL